MRNLAFSNQWSSCNVWCAVGDVYINGVVESVDAVHCRFEKIDHGPSEALIDQILWLSFIWLPET